MEQNNGNNNNQNNDKNPPPNRFGSYWIYILIAAFLIVLNLYMVSGAQNEQINYDRFEQMARQGDVDKVLVINGTEARVFIKDTKVGQGEYKDLTKSRFAARPHYTFTISTPQRFAEKTDELKTKLSEDDIIFDVDYKRETDWFGVNSND